MELNGQNTQSDPNNDLIWEAQSSSYDSDLMSPHADPYVYHTQGNVGRYSLVTKHYF